MHTDFFNGIKPELLTVPANKTATVTSSECDLTGYDGASFLVLFGTSGDALGAALYWSCKLQESDTSGSGFTDVAADGIVGSTANAFGVVNAAADDDAVYGLGYKGKDKIVRVVVTATGVHAAGTIIGILALKKPMTEPDGPTVLGS